MLGVGGSVGVQGAVSAEKPSGGRGGDSAGLPPTPSSSAVVLGQTVTAFLPSPDSSALCRGAERSQAERSVIPGSALLLPPSAQQRVVVPALFQHRDSVGGRVSP